VDFLGVEMDWERHWEEWGIHRFNWEDTARPVFVIDTPPPYPSGDFHMGNVLNWTYIDVVARYKRMCGFNVLFPQGWDCHGLPTEVATEKAHKIRRSDVSPAEFRRLCEEWVNQYIDIMKKAIIRLGCSVDWTTEYKTMDPNYWRKTQLSFVLLYQKDLVYRGEHPINWCPRCETAIADAEVEHEKKRGQFAYIRFKLKDQEEAILIATTRPEYIPACVVIAVHPDEERYKHLIGERALIPLFDREVEIVADEAVDRAFGTGAMMICTYGDKADVAAVAHLHLPVIKLVDEQGRLTKEAGRYAGMTTEEAKKAILRDLKKEGLLDRTESIEQEVGICWRCKTPIEILLKKQWFMKTKQLTGDVVDTTMKIDWFPDYMKFRLIDWTNSLDWDWVISRQRVFATPIPVWYCAKCDEVVVADAEELPVDPKTTTTKKRCTKCGGGLVPERDVLDTWFDSSISCAHHAGWPDRPDWHKFYPDDLHPSGNDIIRTWAYYLIVRSLALFGETPYKAALINGMVLGSDGRKMSKSLGNYVSTPEVFNKYGSDAARQWATGGGSTGSDVPFRWEDVEYGRRFMRKLWNACRFTSMQLENFDPKHLSEELTVLDRWLLSRLERLIVEVTEALESYQFSNALNAVRNFTWHMLCDHYIEDTKHRFYKEAAGRSAAQFTLYHGIYRVLQLLAPFCPHITEEIYQNMFAEKERDSIHLTNWPELDRSKIDDEAEKRGDMIVALIRDVRGEKARRGLPLNAELRSLTIYAGDSLTQKAIEEGLDDIAATVKASEVEIMPIKGAGTVVDGYSDISFTFIGTAAET